MTVRLEQKINEFLERHLLDASCFRWEEELDRFLAEMASARDGEPASVKMIPSWLGYPRPISRPVSVTAIDIGGTNVRSTAVTLDEHGIVSLDRLPPFPTPGVNRPMTTDEFFRSIAARISPHLDTERISICFSLAANPLRDRDAVVSAGAKQLCVTDLIGKRVGQSFRQAAEGLGLPHDQQITVINDAVAALLGGWSEHQRDQYSGFLGFIYGTGTNLSYQEPGGEMINVESGAYCGFPCGDIDDRYDATLIDARQDRFEKMVSGGYQGGLMTCILLTAAEEGLLPADFCRRLFRPGSGPLTAGEISGFSGNPRGENRIARACTGEQERVVLTELFDAVTRRSAFLCGITVTGALLRSGIGLTPESPAFITAEGSTYLKQKEFRELLYAYMVEHAAEAHGLHYEFHPVPDAVLKGTAIAALAT